MKILELTQAQKLELGIEIVAALHAEMEGLPIETGRRLALLETEIDEQDPDKDKPEYRRFIERNKKRLHDQALYLANAALSKIESLT